VDEIVFIHPPNPKYVGVAFAFPNRSCSFSLHARIEGAPGPSALLLIYRWQQSVEQPWPRRSRLAAAGALAAIAIVIAHGAAFTRRRRSWLLAAGRLFQVASSRHADRMIVTAPMPYTASGGKRRIIFRVSQLLLPVGS
jgi:hypothetical protein